MLSKDFESADGELLPVEEEAANLAITWARTQGHVVDRLVIVTGSDMFVNLPPNLQGCYSVGFTTGYSLGGGRYYWVNVTTGEVKYAGTSE